MVCDFLRETTRIQEDNVLLGAQGGVDYGKKLQMIFFAIKYQVNIRCFVVKVLSVPVNVKKAPDGCCLVAGMTIWANKRRYERQTYLTAKLLP